MPPTFPVHPLRQLGRPHPPHGFPDSARGSPPTGGGRTVTNCRDRRVAPPGLAKRTPITAAVFPSSPIARIPAQFLPRQPVFPRPSLTSRPPPSITPTACTCPRNLVIAGRACASRSSVRLVDSDSVWPFPLLLVINPRCRLENVAEESEISGTIEDCERAKRNRKRAHNRPGWLSRTVFVRHGRAFFNRNSAMSLDVKIYQQLRICLGVSGAHYRR